ncbi:hypothetical protein [Komagataeibacter europaeus]|nr:hypothetical protein [Komagataeibacter europaeus]
MRLERFLHGGRWLHVCIDMQDMFREKTPWHAPWMTNILPDGVSIVKWHAANTVSARFIPPRRADDTPPELSAFSSPDTVFDKRSETGRAVSDFTM